MTLNCLPYRLRHDLFYPLGRVFQTTFTYSTSTGQVCIITIQCKFQFTSVWKRFYRDIKVNYCLKIYKSYRKSFYVLMYPKHLMILFDEILVTVIIHPSRMALRLVALLMDIIIPPKRIMRQLWMLFRE